MKFASGIFTLALAGGIAVDGMSIRGNTKHSNKLMAFSRRLEDSGDSEDSDDSEESGDYDEESGDNENDEYDDMSDDEKVSYFLKDYSITLLSCIQGQQVTNYENGETESSTVIFRLCPSDSCNSTVSMFGCDDGYGDYIVGIDTFLEAYRESQEEDSQDNDDQYVNSLITYNQWGQEFDASEYMECSEYKQEEGDEQDQNGNQYQGSYYQDTQFFIGPGCSENGTAIALHTYYDEDCSYPFEGNFSMISPGWESLPFSDGGLVSMDCVSCSSVDDDNKVEVSEMCSQEFQSSVGRCEQTMDSGNYYHKTSTSGCDNVDSLLTSVYGNLTDNTNSVFDNTLSTVKTTVDQVSTKFMDTMSTREAQTFIALMVIFALSFLIGVGSIACICVKKRRKRMVKKNATKLLPSGSGDHEPSIQMHRSSVVALVRSGTNSIKKSMVAAVTGTKDAAAAAAAVVKDEDDSTVKSEYNNIEDAIIDTSGSYKAPEAEEDSAPAPESSLATNDATPGEESVTASDATERTRGGGFISKMDKHLKKRLSAKPFVKKN